VHVAGVERQRRGLDRLALRARRGRLKTLADDAGIVAAGELR
jgi:hypothetical protein